MAYTTENSGLSLQEMMQMYQNMQPQQQQPTVNQGAQSEKTAAGVIKPISGALSAIPIAGPIIAGVGSLVSMGLELDASGKQKRQAEQDAQKAAMMKATLPKEFYDKVRADKFAAASPTPGLEQAHEALASDFATHLRAIVNNTRNGGQAAHAIATALGFNNESLAKLYATNLAFQSKRQETARQDLWDIGLAKQGAEQTLFNNYQKPLYQQSTALQNAATANRVGAIGGIAKAASMIGSSILKESADSSNFDQMISNYTKPSDVSPAPVATELTGTTQQYNPVWDATLGNESYKTAPDAYNIPAADQSLNTPNLF